jgi:excisionase family DNA binding protein
MFGVSQSLIYKMIDRGELPDVRFAGCRVIPAEAVDAAFQYNPGPSKVGQAARDAVAAKSQQSVTP